MPEPISGLTEAGPGPVSLIPATEADYPSVVDLANRAYRGTGPEASWNVENVIEGQRITLDLLREDLAAKPHAQLLLWRSETGSLLGCAWLEPTEPSIPENAGTWYLGLLAVDPRQQKQHLGRTLLAAAEDYARTRGARQVRMTVVNVRVPLIAWYLRRGYTLTGETEPYPYGDNRFGRPLRDDIHFVILEKAI
jgi:ribosomal protein S18 acetylase RimI-like enzyme